MMIMMMMLMMLMMLMMNDDGDDDDGDDMALHGDEDHDDQARSKAMLETAFQSDAFERVPKQVPNWEHEVFCIHFDCEMCFAPQRRAIFHLLSGQLAPRPSL